MFNSGIRNRRAKDNEGIINPQNKFIQSVSPLPSISSYSISGFDDTALDPAGGQTIIVNGQIISESYHQPQYYNYLQTTLAYKREFPTASDAIVGGISIPKSLYGDNINPNTFILTAESGSVIDDGEGNLICNNKIIGNININSIKFICEVKLSLDNITLLVMKLFE